MKMRMILVLVPAMKKMKNLIRIKAALQNQTAVPLMIPLVHNQTMIKGRNPVVAMHLDPENVSLSILIVAIKLLINNSIYV
jgi:hypothetical protein